MLPPVEVFALLYRVPTNCAVLLVELWDFVARPNDVYCGFYYRMPTRSKRILGVHHSITLELYIT